jgi:hypothetical protein
MPLQQYVPRARRLARAADGTITNVNGGLCLDATGGATANGTKLVLWTCNGSNNQKWTLS